MSKGRDKFTSSRLPQWVTFSVALCPLPLSFFF